MSARAWSALAALCASVAGCNLVLGLSAGTERGAGGGGGAAGAAGGAEGAAAPDGGGGSIGGGGGEGGGAGGCGPEEDAGPGREIVVNGSFERGAGSWLPDSLAPLTFGPGFCGCQSAVTELPDGYAELRNNAFHDLPSGTIVRAHARLRAPDEVAAELDVRGSNNNLRPPASFQDDADDAEGEDGWRLAELQWTVPVLAFDQTYVYIALNGPPGTEIAFDCISVTVEPP